MERAEVVIIGGGIAGCSVAYHLARAGWDGIVLLEKGELTSGSTHHAAGLVTQFNPSSTMMAFRRYSVALYRELGVFAAVGSVRVASSRDSLLELRRAASRAAALGLEVELLSPEEVVERLPGAAAESVHGGVWMPGDGHVDPHIATHALANAARKLGVEIRLRTRVEGIELGPDRAVRRVRTDAGPIETPCVVCAAGIWAPQVAAMVGAFLASVPVDHQHVLLQAVPGHEVARDAPCFRDPDNLVYGRPEAGGMLVGGYEPEPPARWTDGVPWEHGASPVESDFDRFAPLLEGAIRRFPFLEDAGVVRLLCHPDAMTPDGNPLLGPMPGVPGFWVAAGFSLNGFGAAGGLGRSLAEWMTTGSTELDVEEYRAWRFGPLYRDTVLAAETAREAYKYYYRQRYPLDTPAAGRGRRLSPLHVRLEELGAVFGTKGGWERADRFEPGRRWRRAGEDQRAFGWTTPPYLDRLASEHAAFRERAGIVDLTSFGKLAVSGPGALALLERVCDNRIDRPVGTAVYTQWLNVRGGIVADVTVTRLEEERFRVITGAAAAAGDLGRLRLAVRADDAPVELRDETGEFAVIGLWGPRARDVLGAVTDDDDVGARAIRFRAARVVTVGGAAVLAQRISYVGELGFELYVAPEWAVQVWDRLMAAGRDHGLEPGGYQVLDSLRIEKGFRVVGSDLTAGDTPYEAGLGFCVAEDKDFVGADALAAARAAGPRKRLRTLVVGDGEYLQLYGGEAVRVDGTIAGRIRSAAFGFTVGSHLAVASLPPEVEEGAEVVVEVLGEPVGARVAADVMYDPEQVRMRG